MLGPERTGVKVGEIPEIRLVRPLGYYVLDLPRRLWAFQQRGGQTDLYFVNVRRKLDQRMAPQGPRASQL